MIDQHEFGALIGNLVSQAESQLSEAGFAKNRCLLSSTLLRDAINALPLDIRATRWEGNLLVRNLDAWAAGLQFRAKRTVEAVIEANPPTLKPNETGGHVAVIVNCRDWDSALFIDPTIGQLRRVEHMHGWRCDVPDILIMPVKTPLDFMVERSFPASILEVASPLMRIHYTAEALQMLVANPNAVGWSNTHAYTETRRHYIDGFLLAVTECLNSNTYGKAR